MNVATSRCDAVVASVDDEGVWVTVAGRASACGQCPSSAVCGDAAGQERRYRLTHAQCLSPGRALRPGDPVVLTLPAGALWRASLLAYVAPLILALLGAAVGQSVWASDAACALGALAGLSLGAALLRCGELRWRARRTMRPARCLAVQATDFHSLKESL